MKLTKENIMKVMNDHKDEYEFFGLRYDSHEYKVGETMHNSHQWYQDDPANWGEDLPYNEDLRLWDGGELDGTCAIEIEDGNIENAMRVSSGYEGGHLYLIASEEAWAGNDYMEIIMVESVVIAEFE